MFSPILNAPERFAAWMSANQHVDKKTRNTYRYHSRSDSHSKAISGFVLDDLLAACPTLRAQAAAGRVVYGVNFKYLWPKSAKPKTIDLAIGLSGVGPAEALRDVPIAQGPISRVLLSMEAKSTMTEHVKSQPRMFDELSSSYAIVNNGDDDAIAAGLAVINIADRFASPLRQQPDQPIRWSAHKQPEAARRMIEHLRGLSIRRSVAEKGFDAYATIVVSCDNQAAATLWTDPPAPQPGDRDHYLTFVADIAAAYVARFGGI